MHIRWPKRINTSEIANVISLKPSLEIKWIIYELFAETFFVLYTRKHNGLANGSSFQKR